MFIGQFGQAKEPEPESEPPSADEFRKRLKETSHICPDLHSQYESLLDEVWKDERYEAQLDRIDLAVKAEEWREKARKRAKK